MKFKWLVCWAAMWLVSIPASAQTACSHTNIVSAHREPERSSVVHRVGDLTLITWQDGTTTTMSRQGEFSVVTDSSHGANCVAHHVGDITIVNLEKFTVVCTTTGPSTLCIKS
jgi:hypothetical protein